MKDIVIGSDHAGYDLKQVLIEYLNKQGQKILDEGTYSNESTDYPDYAHKVATEVAKQEALGILICGSANGVAMAANKHSEIRAAICWTSELAVLARQHNNANILCLPARFISIEEARGIVDAFLETSFEGGRHEKRVNKIACQ